MKFLHLADLHFGKYLYGCSMIDRGDQSHWKEQLLQLVEEEKPQAIVIAGDVYDRSAPSNEAVALLDELLTELVGKRQLPVMMIAGNHDSGRRLSFGSSLLKEQKLYIAGVLQKELCHVTLTDEYGPVTFWLMPYLFPAEVSKLLEAEDIRDYDTAVRRLLACQEIDFTRRNVLVAHQNVTVQGKEVQRGGSESMVGGIGAVDYTAFDGFDYVALGHIHSNYHVGRETVRYAGSPLCYHFEETRQAKKGPVVVTLGDKDTTVDIRTAYLPPLHPLREIKGTLAEIIEKETNNTARGEYIRVVLQEEQVTPDAAARLRALFASHDSLLLEFTAELRPFRNAVELNQNQSGSQKSEEALFNDFYMERRGGELPDEKQRELFSFVGELVRNASTEDKAAEPPEADVARLVDFILGQED